MKTPPALKRRPLLRLLRNLLIIAVLAGFLADRYGLPALRVSYTYTGSREAPNYRSCQYLSVTGIREARFEEFEKGCPLVTVIPMERPLLVYAKELWHSISKSDE